MSTAIPAPIRRITAVVLVVALLSPASMGAAAGASDDAESASSYVRSVDEIRGHLLISIGELEDGDREAATYHAGEPLAEQWPVVGPALAAENATLERELETALEAARAAAGNESASEYAELVHEEVMPLLERAETAAVSEQRLDNATFNAQVVAGLLERARAEYGEGVAEDGSIGEAGDYRAAIAFADQAEARYENGIRGSVSDHAAEELDELFERLTGGMNQTAAPDEIERLSGSITHELAEYTGIEAEAAGDGVEAIERIESDLHEAVEAYEAGDSAKAKSLIKGTYLSNFEGIEGTLIESDPELVEELEGDFNEELPGLIEEEASVADVREQVEEMETKLESAEGILADQEDTDIDLTKENTTTTESDAGDGSGGYGESGDNQTTSTSTPGFGILAAAVALGLIAAARYRS